MANDRHCDVGARCAAGLARYRPDRRTAQLARDWLGTLLCVGVLSMLVFQVFQNVGMTMGIMPVIGIPLPFISSGGSSLVGFGLLIGVLLSMDSSWMRSRRSL